MAEETHEGGCWRNVLPFSTQMTYQKFDWVLNTAVSKCHVRLSIFIVVYALIDCHICIIPMSYAWTTYSWTLLDFWSTIDHFSWSPKFTTKHKNLSCFSLHGCLNVTFQDIVCTCIFHEICIWEYRMGVYFIYPHIGICVHHLNHFLCISNQASKWLLSIFLHMHDCLLSML